MCDSWQQRMDKAEATERWFFYAAVTALVSPVVLLYATAIYMGHAQPVRPGQPSTIIINVLPAPTINKIEVQPAPQSAVDRHAP